jgi:DnaK suppressor protein
MRMIGIKKIASSVEAQRKVILDKLRRLRREDPFSTTDRSLIVEPATDAAALFGHEQIIVLEQKLKNDLKEIEKALIKIKKGTYGICERCNKKIDANRLAVKASAIYCVSCEKELEKKNRRK